MHCVIYYFQVKPNKEKEFISSWLELTETIYKNAVSLGSRLHKKAENEFIAYAQWPDKLTYDSAKIKLPIESKRISKKMKSFCDEIKTVFHLEVVVDLLKNKTYQ